MIPYETEELLPLVAKLAERYTSKDSSSITYEAARNLMEAILYCINEYGGDTSTNQLQIKNSISAQTAYDLGYERVVQKIIRVQKRYNEMILEFNAYGNENYWDTVTKALPGFFRYYDAVFAPQNTIITMDYPVLGYDLEGEGIDVIEQYLHDISLEQKFLRNWNEEYVLSVLSTYQVDYSKQFYNICSIVLRNILACMLTNKKMNQATTQHDYERLQSVVEAYDNNSLEERLSGLLRDLVFDRIQGRDEMFQYLSLDLNDFVTELKNGAEYHHLSRVVVL